MSAEYMHIGIPVTNRKPGMTYNEGAKFWVSNVDDYDYKIEYLKFEEGTPFPEEIHRNPHVAYKKNERNGEQHRQRGEHKVDAADFGFLFLLFHGCARLPFLLY